MAPRVMVGLGTIAAGVVVGASPAFACGGLVGENGTIQLARTTTLAAYHDGVERYVTSFEFTGEGKEVGSIVPLPGVPTDGRAGRRLDAAATRSARSRRPAGSALAAARRPRRRHGARCCSRRRSTRSTSPSSKGGGDAVGQWALDHGFLLTPDAPEVLDFYAPRSPVFMAARFDASRAAALGQQSGDGTPIMLTIPIDRPWVPLRILGLGLDARPVDRRRRVPAHRRPAAAAGRRAGPRASSAARPAVRRLLTDLRSDKGMEWVPDDDVATYLRRRRPAGDLTYDLAMSTDAKVAPSLTDVGFALRSAGSGPVAVGALQRGRPLWPMGAGGGAAALALGTGLAVTAWRRASRPRSLPVPRVEGSAG